MGNAVWLCETKGQTCKKFWTLLVANIETLFSSANASIPIDEGYQLLCSLASLLMEVLRMLLFYLLLCWLINIFLSLLEVTSKFLWICWVGWGGMQKTFLPQPQLKYNTTSTIILVGFAMKMTLHATPLHQPQKLNNSLQGPHMNFYWPQLVKYDQ